LNSELTLNVFRLISMSVTVCWSHVIVRDTDLVMKRKHRCQSEYCVTILVYLLC